MINSVFAHPEFSHHENVVFCRDAASGLSAIIAIHSTVLGPGLGGCRMAPYGSDMDALSDVLRLSRGMTYKNALAGLPYGGAKAVIIGDPYADKTPAMLAAFGRHIEHMAGRYITGEDVGISVADMEAARSATAHVRGIAEGGAGDPSPATAYGVFAGIQAALLHRTGSHDLRGKIVSLQGLGNVGMHLLDALASAGAEVYVSDVRPDRVAAAVSRYGARTVEASDAHQVQADVFAPCALGAVLNASSISELGAGIVAGAANNQLALPEDGERLRARGILYCPDYVINAGGVISIAHEGPCFERARMLREVARIGDTLGAIFRDAEAASLPTEVVADRRAEEVILARLEQGAHREGTALQAA
ncbi:MAG: Glu/Leu/Phe/Val dehydrogenase dimerization domain-containing protein [Pseudomonadota bacterium]